MANRAPVARRSDDALFVKNGVPVKFCFHRSVTQGRSRITRDIERHGGQIVPHERLANVLLIDEQEDLAFFRRRYYSSTEMYRLSLYVEQRGFVQACLRAGVYHHSGPIKQGMPGRARGAGRQRVPFTEEDRDHLAYYLATRCPTRDGRMGNNPYKDLERLSQTDDPSWAWARRHTFHSWREHYKMNPEQMDTRIDFYLQRLEGIGHHFGHDPRMHNNRDLRRELREEEEEGGEEEEEEEEGQRQGRQDRERREQVRPLVAAQRRPGQAARDYLARHEQDLVSFDEEEGSDGAQEAEEDIVEPQRRYKRHRADLGAHRQRDTRETQAKRVRVSDRASGVKAGRDKESAAREEDTDTEGSQEIEGSDLFGDRIYDDESRFDSDAQEINFPKPFSPRASPVPEQDDPPLSTQATLIASPRSAEKEHTMAPTLTPTSGVKLTLKPAAPLSSQQRLILRQEHVTAQRARGASAQPGPSMSGEMRTRGGAPLDAPLRNARARSHSVDTQSQPEPESRLPPQQKDQGKGKAKEESLVSTEKDVQVGEGPKEAYTEEDIGPVSVTVPETFEDEMAVEGLLEASVEGEHDKESGISDGDEDWDIMSQLSRFQEIEIEGEPSDSDDAETHASLVRGALREGSAGGGDALEKSGNDQEQDQNEGDEDSEEDDADRIERMASGSLHHAPVAVPSPVRPRVTRSMASTQVQTQTQQTSPRRTRSGNQARAAPQPTAFPSPGTKARAVVDRFQEEERRMPYAPPPRTRAAKAVKEKGRRG